MSLKAVIFDFDGTIGDTMELCLESLRQAAEPLVGHSLSDEEIFAVFGPSDEGALQRLVSNHWQQGLTSFLKIYEKLQPNYPDLFPGIEDLLHRLKDKGIILALVTGKGRFSCEISLKFYGLDDLFDHIITGSPERACKDVGLREILDKFHLLPTDAIYIGDARTDIHFSRAVGMPVISAGWAQTTNCEELRKLQPDHLFETVEQLNAFLTKACDLAPNK